MVLLLVVGLLYALWGDRVEAVTAVVVVGCTIGLEVLSEWQAKKAVSALASASFQPPVMAWRSGVGRVRLRPEHLVPGDLLDLAPGDRLVADARIVSATWVLMDESALTGESLGVHKEANVILQPSTPVQDRTNMVSGTQTSSALLVTIILDATAPLTSCFVPLSTCRSTAAACCCKDPLA